MERNRSQSGDESLELTDKELTQFFADPSAAAKFPPILTLEETAELLRVTVGTVRDWRSRGLLPGCARKLGRHVRFIRDRLIKHAFNNGLGE